MFNLSAISAIIGTVIGLGIFPLPYVFFTQGMTVILLVFFIFLLMLLTIFMYGEIIGRFEGVHNFYSYFSLIFGEKLKPYAFLIEFLSLESVLIVYCFYLKDVYGFLSGLLFLLVGHLINFFGLKTFKNVESSFTFLLILIILLTSGYGILNFNKENLNLKLSLDFSSYGLVLFSLTGFSIFPLLKEFLKDWKKEFKAVTLISYFLILLFYLFFVITSSGAFGKNLTPDFILTKTMPFWLKTIMPIFVVLNIFTTFIAIAFYLKKGLVFDWSLKEKLSSFLVFLPNFLVYFLPLGGFLKILEITSSIFIGMTGIMIALCYLKLKNYVYFKIPKIFVFLTILVFLIGIFTVFYNDF